MNKILWTTNELSDNMNKMLWTTNELSEEEDEAFCSTFSAHNQPGQKPPPIEDSANIVDFSFHPKQNDLAAATRDGTVKLYRCSNEGNSLLRTMNITLQQSCLTVIFTVDGTKILTTSRDRSIRLTDTETGQLLNTWEKAHPNPVCKLKMLNDDWFATGDDEGQMKFWDIRRPMLNCESFYTSINLTLTGLDFEPTGKWIHVCAIASNGCQSYVYFDKKIRHAKLNGDKFIAISPIRNNTEVIACTLHGGFVIFTKEEDTFYPFRYSKHSTSTTTMIPVSDNIAITGGYDGYLRAMNFGYKRAMGTLGKHSLEVLTIGTSCDKNLLASCTDSEIFFWNISNLTATSNYNPTSGQN